MGQKHPPDPDRSAVDVPRTRYTPTEKCWFKSKEKFPETCKQRFPGILLLFVLYRCRGAKSDKLSIHMNALPAADQTLDDKIKTRKHQNTAKNDPPINSPNTMNNKRIQLVA